MASSSKRRTRNIFGICVKNRKMGRKDIRRKSKMISIGTSIIDDRRKRGPRRDTGAGAFRWSVEQKILLCLDGIAKEIGNSFPTRKN